MPSPIPRTAVWIVVGLAAAGVGFIGTAYRRDIGAARKRVGAGSRMADTPCGRIEYASVGSGSPLLVVHGAGGGFDQALPFAASFVEAGYRVVTMSRFGYLRTPLPLDASPEAQADAHACLLDALGIERVVGIIGVSAGGPSTLQFALRHRERTGRLILLVPLAYAPRAGHEAKARRGIAILFDTALRSDFLFWLAARTIHRTMVRTILGTPPELLDHADGSERARAEAMLDDILPISPRRQGLVNDAYVATNLRRYALESVTTPTLAISLNDCLYGTYAGARYTAEHIPGARFVGYPSGGHLWVGRQKEVLAEVLDFLRRP